MLPSPSPLALLGAAWLAVTPSPLAPRALSALPTDLQPLASALQQHGFRVVIALPPMRRAFGQYEPRSRTLWISPLSFELGIVRQAVLHEAVHAVQSCPSGTLRPIGWSLPLSPLIANQINGVVLDGYPRHTRALEQEAFALQGQPDAIPRLLRALRERCRSRRLAAR